MVSFSYPIDRLDRVLFGFVILYHQWFPVLEIFENWAFILPHTFPAVLIIFAGRGGEPFILNDKIICFVAFLDLFFTKKWL